MLLEAVLKDKPSLEPMEISEAERHLLISGQGDYVNELILTAREMLERYLNRSFILKTWTAYSDYWCQEFLLPYAPLLSVTSVKYYNINGILTTLNTNQYWVNNKREPGSVRFAYDFSPPELQYGRPNAIEIEYTAGYLATGTNEQKQHAVPDAIRHGMKILMTDMHENRGQYVIGNQASKIPGLVADLIHPHRLYTF